MSVPGILILGALALGLCACGGGGDSGSNSGNSGGSTNGWTAGVFMPEPTYANKCAAPRSGSSAVTNQVFPDMLGSALDEKNWLRSWTNNLYLWYSEVPDQNPADTPNVLDYFALLKTSATTASGQPKDKFHFTYDTAEWEALSQTGVEVGYGLRWEIQAAQNSPARVWIAYLEPGSNTPAAIRGLERGMEVLSVDGVNLNAIFTQSQADTVNAGIFPRAADASHNFVMRERTGSATRAVNMVSVQLTTATVQQVRTMTDGMGKVGYMLFNDHLATAEDALIDAVTTLSQQNITDLVLDVRYNGGGYLDIASQLAYMIAGTVPTAGRTFETLTFNDKHPVTNPVTGVDLQPMPFHDTTLGFSRPQGQALPTLDLARVFVLTGPRTCSASESVINGLRGADVEVIQIGSTTCGKPYGFYATDNCGTTYFSIQFKGVNAKNFGDYSDGFSPSNTGGAAGERIAGCSVADDFAHDLGDVAESRFAAALNYRFGQSCPAATGFSPDDRVQPQSAPTSTPWVQWNHSAPWRENRIILP